MNSFSIPLKKLLAINSLVCALTAFFACRNLINPLVFFSFSAAFVFSILTDILKWRHPPRILINLASLAIFGTAIATARIDVIVETFLGAVMMMMAVKMLEDKSARDHVQIVILTVISIVSAAVLTFRAQFVFYYLAASYFFALELLLCTLSARSPELRFSRNETAHLSKRALAIWLMMLPVCLILFFAAPRARVALARAQYQAGRTATAGFVDRVSLGTIGRIQESDEVAFRAEMPHISHENLYWRGLVLNVFENNEWVVRYYRNSRVRDFAVTGEQVRQRIFLEQGQYPIFFTLDKPVMVDGESVRNMGEGVYVRSNPRFAKQVSYSVLSVLSVSMKPIVESFNEEGYLALPWHFSPRIRALVKQLTEGLDEKGKIDAIRSYLGPPSFSYTLENLPISENPLEEFLFSSKEGNCEYYASAMTVMCRMAGIPARLVAGYRGGLYNETGGYYIVRQKNAHAWVEVWDSEENAWLRYDPTPPNELIERSLEQKETGTIAMLFDLLNLRVSRIIIEYSGELQIEIIERLQAFLLNPGKSFQPAVDRVKNAVSLAIYPILAVLLLMGAASVVVIHYRLRGGNPEKILLQSFLTAMKRRGFEKRPYDGLEEFVQTIPEADHGELRDLAWRFAVAFEDDYYRDRPMSKEKKCELKKLVSQINEGNFKKHKE